MAQTYKIIHVGQGDGIINIGVEFNIDNITIDHHNMTFPANYTVDQIHEEIAKQLNDKANRIAMSSKLAESLQTELNVERQVIPTVLSFDPPEGPVSAFPIDIVITADVIDPLMEIRYTVDGSDPGELSPPYRQPISLVNSGTIKAAVFDPNTNIRGRIFVANYTIANPSTPKQISKAMLLSAIPQSDLGKIIADNVAYRVLNSFLVLGPDPVVTTQEVASRVKSFVDQFKAAAILSQAGADAIANVVIGAGWTWI